MHITLKSNKIFRTILWLVDSTFANAQKLQHYNIKPLFCFLDTSLISPSCIYQISRSSTLSSLSTSAFQPHFTPDTRLCTQLPLSVSFRALPLLNGQETQSAKTERLELLCDSCLLKVFITLLLEEAGGRCLSSLLREPIGSDPLKMLEEHSHFWKVKVTIPSKMKN